MERQYEEPRAHPGVTTGSPERPAQQLTGALLRFDIPAELEQLHAEPTGGHEDRNAITLAIEGDLRITLTLLRAGARMDTHSTAGYTSIHVISGQLRLGVDGDSHDLGPGEIVVLGVGVPHDVLALEDTEFLLTIALPGTTAA